MIEKYKTYLPVAEKVAFAKKISPIVVDDFGIINKNDLKIASTCFFVGAYVEDKIFTTNDYDYIKQNKLDSELSNKLEKDEIKEWETILDNEINLIAMKHKMQNTNVMAAVVSLLRSLENKLGSTNFNKAIKEVDKILSDPNKLKNFQSLKDVADKLQ